MKLRIWLVVGLTFAALVAGIFAAPAADSQENKKKKTRDAALVEIDDEPNLPRVLLIGDSISIGYTLETRKLLKGAANVHRILENGGPTHTALTKIDKWLGDGKWDVIHFNWGLHDLRQMEGKHQVPIDEYEANLRKLVERLNKTGATLVWCSTTPVPEGDLKPLRLNSDVLAYNVVAKKVMAEHKIVIDDLYEYAQPQLAKIQLPVNVHFSPEGSAILAKKVAEEIQQALKAKAAK